MSSLMKQAQYGSLAAATALIQIAQSQAPDETADPLIDQDANVAIYVGLALLFVVVIFAIGSLNSKVERALVFAFCLSVVLILILWYL
ncbi:MAG: hypothetical protein WBA76_21155 [Phormidesmis sp.]